MRWFWDITPAQGLAYRAYVERVHNYRLAELAQALRASDVDLDLMDASEYSLVPLWGWAVACVDGSFACLKPDALASQSVAFRVELGRDDRFRQYLSELLEHYVFEVVRRVVPSVTWAVEASIKRGPMSSDANQTLIEVTRGDQRRILELFQVSLKQAAVGHQQARLPGEMVRLTRRVLLNGLPVASSGGPSVLAPLLDRRLEPILPPDLSGGGEQAAQPPSRRTPLPTDSIAQQASEFNLALGVVTADDIDDAASLDVEAITKALNEFGFVTDDEKPITRRDVMRAEDFLSLDGTVMASPMVHRRRLILVGFEIVTDDYDEREAAFAKIAGIARAVGGTLALDDSTVVPLTGEGFQL